MKDLVKEYHGNYKYSDITYCTSYIKKYSKYIKQFDYNWRRIDRFYGPYIFNQKKYRNGIGFIAVTDMPKKY